MRGPASARSGASWGYMSTEAAASWDAQYASGRYRHEPPVGFTRDIISAARSENLRRGLYIGCGNGRNLVPLSNAGLDLISLDISSRAIAQLRERMPGTARLVVGGIDALLPSAEFDLVIGIQVFQNPFVRGITVPRLGQISGPVAVLLNVGMDSAQ